MLLLTARKVIDEPAGTDTGAAYGVHAVAAATRYSMPEMPALSVADRVTLVPPESFGAVAGVVVGATASVKSNVAFQVTFAAFAWPETEGWK